MGDIHSEVSMTSVLIQAKKSKRRLFNMGYSYSREKRKFDAELYFENLTQREIAERMSCSQQNIAKKIEKNKKVLK